MGHRDSVQIPGIRLIRLLIFLIALIEIALLPISLMGVLIIWPMVFWLFFYNCLPLPVLKK